MSESDGDFNSVSVSRDSPLSAPPTAPSTPPTAPSTPPTAPSDSDLSSAFPASSPSSCETNQKIYEILFNVNMINMVIFKNANRKNINKIRNTEIPLKEKQHIKLTGGGLTMALATNVVSMSIISGIPR